MEIAKSSTDTIINFKLWLREIFQNEVGSENGYDIIDKMHVTLREKEGKRKRN